MHQTAGSARQHKGITGSLLCKITGSLELQPEAIRKFDQENIVGVDAEEAA
jgi:hypothetical protein